MENEIRQQRLDKIHELEQSGINPYPVDFVPTTSVKDFVDKFSYLEAGGEDSTEIKLGGRVMLFRGQGKLIFAQLFGQQTKVQLFISEAITGQEHMDFIKTIDLGDWVGVEGTPMSTKKGELSLKVKTLTLLSKCLRPLPDKWSGMSDVDQRFRQREVDLIVNEESRKAFEIRHKAIQSIRELLNEKDFIEVETPVFHHELGGASAKPFTTHHEALGIDLYLRIQVELYLKRCVVGGIERVYEFARTFRNEGLSTRHNPEFTMLEFYQAFSDYNDMMDLTEIIINTAAVKATGSSIIKITNADGEQTEIDLSKSFKRLPMLDSIEQVLGTRVHPSDGLEKLTKICEENKVKVEPFWTPGHCILGLYEELVEPNIVEPTFITDYPKDTSPLTKIHRDDPELGERFELFMDGKEIANGYTEINDPIDQLERFEDQLKEKLAGNDEAGTIDYDFIRALEYGFPPCGGVGIGIDRMVMFLANVQAIREVLLFPTMRPGESLTN